MQPQPIPKSPSRSQAMVPGNVVKPQQKFFRTQRETLKTLPHRIMILRHRVAARSRAIETNSVGVRAMKINRVPVFALFRIPPRRGPVMMGPPKEVMQSQRRHVINYRLMRLQHDARNHLARGCIVCERHGYPLSRDLFRGEIRIPRQAAEGVPVRLRKMMAGPIAVGSGVRHPGDPGNPLMVQSAVYYFGYGRTGPLRVSI